MNDSVDSLLGGRISLRQPIKGFRAAIDPIVLAASVPVRAGERVLDIGCGTGAATLCLAARVDECSVTGLEIQSKLIRSALRNVSENGLRSQINILQGDVVTPPIEIVEEMYDHVMANPPFMVSGRGNPPEDLARATATIEGKGGIKPWISLPERVLKNKGTLTLIHHADRLADILALMRIKFGNIKVFPLWPRQEPETAAKRIIIHATKGSNGPLILMHGLVLHNLDGSFTMEADAILRDAQPIML